MEAAAKQTRDRQPQLIGVEQFRQNLREALAALKNQYQPLYITKRGKLEAVLMSAEAHKVLLERIEYLEDSIEVMKMDQIDESEFVPLDEVKSES